MKKLSVLALVLAASACPVDKPSTGAAAADAGVAAPLPTAATPPRPSSEPKSAIAALPMGSPVLIVDGVIYTRADLERAISQHAASTGLPPESIDDGVRQALEEPAYEKLLDRHLMSAEAKRRGLWPSDETIAAEKTRIMQSIPSGMTSDTFLQKLNTDDAGFGKEIAIDLALGKLFEAMQKDQKIPDDAALRKIYEDNKAVFVSPETGSASHIFLQLPPGSAPDKTEAAKKRAEELRGMVVGKDKATFARVASEHSEDPNAKKNKGDLGTFPRGALVSQLDEVAFALKDGEISPVVRSDFGLHILRGQGINKAVQRNFDEVKSAIVERERGRLFMTGLETFIAGLRQKSQVQRVVEPMKSPLPPNMGGMRPPPGAQGMPMPMPPGGGAPPAPKKPAAPPATVPPGGAAG